MIRAAELVAAKAFLTAVCVSSNDGKGQAGAAGFYTHMGFVPCAAYEDERLPARAAFEVKTVDPSVEYFMKKVSNSKETG